MRWWRVTSSPSRPATWLHRAELGLRGVAPPAQTSCPPPTCQPISAFLPPPGMCGNWVAARCRSNSRPPCRQAPRCSATTLMPPTQWNTGFTGATEPRWMQRQCLFCRLRQPTTRCRHRLLVAQQTPSGNWQAQRPEDWLAPPPASPSMQPTSVKSEPQNLACRAIQRWISSSVFHRHRLQGHRHPCLQRRRQPWLCSLSASRVWLWRCRTEENNKPPPRREKGHGTQPRRGGAPDAHRPRRLWASGRSTARALQRCRPLHVLRALTGRITRHGTALA